MVRGRVRYISSSSLSYISWADTLNSIYKSPLTPPFNPASPFPWSLRRLPVSIPAGIFTVIFLFSLTWPVPLHLVHFFS